MEYTNIRISVENSHKIKGIAEIETKKRGANISSTLVLSEILAEYFKKYESTVSKIRDILPVGEGKNFEFNEGEGDE